MESAYIVSRSRLVSNDDLSQDTYETEHRCFKRAVDAIDYYRTIRLDHIWLKEYKMYGIKSYLVRPFCKELYFAELDEDGEIIEESIELLSFDYYGHCQFEDELS